MKKAINTSFVDYFIDEALPKSINRIYLEAPGGFGKTTSLKKLCYELSKNYSEYGVIPIYIDCNTVVDSVEATIANRFCNIEFNESNKIDSFNIKTALYNALANTKYRFVLIFDGLNEVKESVSDLIVIDFLRNANPKILQNAFVIVASRGNNNMKYESVFEYYKKLLLRPLPKKTIINLIEEYISNPSAKLVEILSVPIMLSLFIKTDDKVRFESVKNSSELLNAYFDEEIQKAENITKLNAVQVDLFEFVINEFLPKLCSSGKYLFNSNELNDCINYFDDDFFCSVNIKNQGRTITDFIVKHLKLGHIENKELKLHQIYADYFHAKYYEEAINQNIIEPFEKELSNDVKLAIGELIGEYKFEDKQDTKSEMSPLESFMYKNAKNLSAVAVSNIVEIMKSSRNTNITACYDNLNLTNSIFIGCSLPNSTFNDSKIAYNNFEYVKIKSDLSQVSSRGDFVAVSSKENVIILNINNLIPILCFNCEYSITGFEFDPAGKYLLICSGNYIFVFNLQSGQTHSFFDESIAFAFFDLNNNIYTYNTNGKLCLREVNGNIIWKKQMFPDVKSISVSYSRKEIFCYYGYVSKNKITQNLIRVFDIDTMELKREVLCYDLIRDFAEMVISKDEIILKDLSKTIFRFNPINGEFISKSTFNSRWNIFGLCYNETHDCFIDVEHNIICKRDSLFLPIKHYFCSWPHKIPSECVSVDTKKGEIVIANSTGDISVWNIQPFSLKAMGRNPVGEIRGIDISNDTIVGTNMFDTFLWNVNNNSLEIINSFTTERGKNSFINAGYVIANDEFTYSVISGIWLSNLSNQTRIKTVNHNDGTITFFTDWDFTKIEMSKSNVGFGIYDGTIYKLDFRCSTKEKIIDNAYSFIYEKNTEQIICCNNKKEICIYDTFGELIKKFHISKSIKTINSSIDGKYIYSNNKDHFYVWNLETKQRLNIRWFDELFMDFKNICKIICNFNQELMIYVIHDDGSISVCSKSRGVEKYNCLNLNIINCDFSKAIICGNNKEQLINDLKSCGARFE